MIWDEIVVCGSLHVSDLSNPPFYSRHLVLPVSGGWLDVWLGYWLWGWLYGLMYVWEVEGLWAGFCVCLCVWVVVFLCACILGCFKIFLLMLFWSFVCMWWCLIFFIYLFSYQTIPLHSLKLIFFQIQLKKPTKIVFPTHKSSHQNLSLNPHN